MSQADSVPDCSKTDCKDRPKKSGGTGILPVDKTGFQPVKEFKIYRRNLPHFERPGSLYFITFRTAADVILGKEALDIVFNSIKFHRDKKYALYACVIMPDHAHMILKPL